MEIPFVSVPVFILCLLCAGFVQSQDPFDALVEDVKNNLPSSDFSKLYKLNHDSDDQVVKALQKAGSTFASTIDTSVPGDIAQNIDDLAMKFGNFTPDQFYRVFAKALAGTFVDQGILNSGNEKDIANTYVDKLQDAANSLDGENIMDTLPAVANATAKVFKDKGLTGLELIERDFSNNLFQQIKNE